MPEPTSGYQLFRKVRNGSLMKEAAGTLPVCFEVMRDIMRRRRNNHISTFQILDPDGKEVDLSAKPGGGASISDQPRGESDRD